RRRQQSDQLLHHRQRVRVIRVDDERVAPARDGDRRVLVPGLGLVQFLLRVGQRTTRRRLLRLLGRCLLLLAGTQVAAFATALPWLLGRRLLRGRLLHRRCATGRDNTDGILPQAFQQPF